MTRTRVMNGHPAKTRSGWVEFWNENTPESAPDSLFPIRSPPGKARKTPGLGSRGKSLQNRPRLPKFARFRCQLWATKGPKTEANVDPYDYPSGTRKGQKNADMGNFFWGRILQIVPVLPMPPASGRGRNKARYRAGLKSPIYRQF